MRLALMTLATAAGLGLSLFGCQSKITRISVVCRAADQPTDTVHWFYASKVDPTVIKEIPASIDITVHYDGAAPRAVPSITTYFYRPDGAALRVVSTATATMPPAGAFIYHVDTGGYNLALLSTGREEPEELSFVVAVDGSYFGGLLSAPTCGRWPDGHLDIGKAPGVPDLKGKHPLDMAAADWLKVSSLPTAVLRTEGPEVSTYAYFTSPIALTGTGDETPVPEDLAKRAAEVGVTPATPTFAITGAPTPYIGSAPGADLIRAAPAENPLGAPGGATGGASGGAPGGAPGGKPGGNP
jgi:hypothetical protein